MARRQRSQYARVQICIRAYWLTHARVHTHTPMCAMQTACTSTRTHACTLTRSHTDTHTRSHTDTHTRIHAHTLTRTHGSRRHRRHSMSCHGTARSRTVSRVTTTAAAAATWTTELQATPDCWAGLALPRIVPQCATMFGPMNRHLITHIRQRYFLRAGLLAGGHSQANRREEGQEREDQEVEKRRRRRWIGSRKIKRRRKTQPCSTT